MEYPKEILVKDYFEIHEYYSKIYGYNRTIILMQVGSFHEVYCTDNEGLDLQKLSQELDVYCTRKNGNLPLSRSNPRMIGFPIHVTINFIDKLVDMNYTVVLIDQVSEPPKPIRKVVGIYSPATHIEKKSDKSHMLVSIVLEKTKNNQLCIGLSAYDMATGEGSVFEAYSRPNDIMLGLDDSLRFLENFPPKEIILENNLKSDDNFANMKMDDILAYLGIDTKNTYSVKISHHKKINWQVSFLNKIYKTETNINIIELLGLENLSWARLSLVLLLEYVLAHQPRLVEYLKYPTLFSNNKFLYLGNRALEQLDVFTKNETNLFNIINFTKTAIGKRYLYSQLSMPLIDSTQLNQRYNSIEKIIKENHYNKIVDFLEDIYDLDKLIRKLEINILHPYELYQLYLSYYQINKLSEYLQHNNLLQTFEIDNTLLENNKKILEWINNTFILEQINNLNFNNFYESENTFYNTGIHNDIDNLQNSINSSKNFISNLVIALEKYIDDKIYFNKNKDDNDDEKRLINTKFNERDGHYLLITNRRCEMLRKNLSSKKITKLKIGDIELKIEDLEFSPLPKSSNTKINCKKIQELSNGLVNYKIALGKKLKEEFKKDMKYLLETFGNTLYTWSKKIAFIDFINSGAICAINNHYSKPKINNKISSFFKAKEMRHPIIERINTDTGYIPHDIELGYETNQTGILLYGINSSGKSTLMKSIGLNLILAQIGYYTACSNYEFSPYNSLFTRICGNDNMFKGLSSFMVEMMELIAILKRNDNKTLMIGDELCRGTEIKSAITIVCYMLETLSNIGTSFITATHLHDIASIESVKKLSNVKFKHLKITYDPLKDLLIYDRHLSDGVGETFYGLQVAKFLMKDTKFNERTNELLNEYNKINTTVSKYNSNVYISKCEICESNNNLETHHIIWQKDFNDKNINESKYYLQKNDSSNLVVLCRECHDKVDRDEINIKGWLNTSHGRKLDYSLNENPPLKSKHSDDLIKYIKLLKKETKDPKIARIKIKEKFDRKVSTKSIIHYWS
jgi:DNA mismatch repair protein MutS